MIQAPLAILSSLKPIILTMRSYSAQSVANPWNILLIYKELYGRNQPKNIFPALYLNYDHALVLMFRRPFPTLW